MINNGSEDAVERVMAMTGGLGVDVAVEAVGVPETFELCTAIVQARWSRRERRCARPFGDAPSGDAVDPRHHDHDRPRRHDDDAAAAEADRGAAGSIRRRSRRTGSRSPTRRRRTTSSERPPRHTRSRWCSRRSPFRRCRGASSPRDPYQQGSSSENLPATRCRSDAAAGRGKSQVQVLAPIGRNVPVRH